MLTDARGQLEREIREAYLFLREKNHTIPSDTLVLMRDSAIKELNRSVRRKLSDRILDVGVDNCMFMLSMRPINSFMGFNWTSSSDEELLVPATISEKKWKVSQDYKTTLESVYPQFGWQHFYFSDLEMLIDKGQVVMFHKDKVT